MSWVVPEITTDSQESNRPVKPTHPSANLSSRLSKVHWSQETWKGPHWKSGRRLSGPAETRLAEGPRGDSPCPMAPSTLALVKACSAARPGSHWCSHSLRKLFWLSWILGRALAWPCLGPTHLAGLKREKMLGCWAATVTVPSWALAEQKGISGA